MPLAFPLTIDTRRATQDRVLCLGDSYVAGYGNRYGSGGGFMAPLGWRVRAAQMNALGALKTTAGVVTQDPNNFLIPWIQDGVSGTGIADFLLTDNGGPRYQTRIINHSPTIIFYLVSQNDYGATQSTFNAAANTTFNAVDAALPTVRVCFISNFYGGSEQWTAGGWDQSIINNANCTAINNIASTWLAGRDQSRYIWLYLRGDAISDANTILNYESVHNTPAPGVSNGIIFDNTGHPIKGFGYSEICDMIWPRLNVLT